MKRVSKRGLALGERAAALRREAVLADAREVPGISASITGDDVVIEGRALLDRWVDDARLLYIGRGG